MKKSLLKIHNLDIGYKKASKTYHVQTDLNLSLNEGELICLIGPNGVGKSTLLKTLARIIPELKGEILIQDKNLKSLNQRDFSQNIGVVLTEHIDVPQMKAMDIISMGRYPYTGFWGKLNRGDLAIIETVAKQVGISDLLNRSFDELSDGEKQKVMIAKVLAQETPLMLLDEPTAFLDFPTKSSLLIMLRKLAREQNIGIILSTHDIELALKTADQIWLFPEQKKMIHGIPEDLVLKGDILKVFENADMTFNLSTGHFEKVLYPKRTIFVQGDHLSSFWLKKALLRNDIENSVQSEWMVDCGESFDIYQNKELKIQLQSIKDVLDYFKIE
jgi:iron complex transport system ATP-binding protein